MINEIVYEDYEMGCEEIQMGLLFLYDCGDDLRNRGKQRKTEENRGKQRISISLM